jgi:pyruvate dehydrogenase E2 component (dihydrolipoamide acetyltransferase)
MAMLLRVPEVATGAKQALLTEWLVAENTRFSAGDPIVVLETDKAAVEVEAEVDAVLLRTLVPGGTNVEVGVPIALLGQEAEAADVEKLLSHLGIGATEAAAEKPVVAVETSSGERIFISPLARKLLKEAGLAPEQVRGTGPGGRIIRRDVDQAIAAALPESKPAVAPIPPVAPAEKKTEVQFQKIPHSRLRLAVAKRLTESKRDIPHFYVRRTVRIDALLALREQLNAVSPDKISVNDLVIRAVGCAHTQVPDANVIWTEDSVHRFGTVDVGVAIAGKRGLVTPVLRGVEKTTPSAISRQVKEFVRQADEGKLQQRDLEGGTIAVSNLGMYGVEEFSAIINPPQSAILAVGAGRQAPVVVDGEITVATQMALTLSVDHRAIDGALAAQWMAALAEALEQPFRLVA